jgi:hypothetical protein
MKFLPTFLYLLYLIIFSRIFYFWFFPETYSYAKPDNSPQNWKNSTDSTNQYIQHKRDYP